MENGDEVGASTTEHIHARQRRVSALRIIDTVGMPHRQGNTRIAGLRVAAN